MSDGLETTTLPLLPLRSGVILPHMVVTIMLETDEARHAVALHVLAPHQMAGTLRRDHSDVHLGARLDLLEVDREAVGEHQHHAGPQVGLDAVAVEPGLADVAVFLDANGDGALQSEEPSARSAADGTYLLTGLRSGSNRVCVLIPAALILPPELLMLVAV